MRITSRLLLLLIGVFLPLNVLAAKPPINGGANQNQKPNANQNQQQQNPQQQNQNGANLTAQAIQYSVQQLMSLDKNQSGGVEGNEVVNAQVQRLCRAADADQNGSVTAAEFTAALNTVASTTATVGGNSATAVLIAAGCGQGNNQAAAAGNSNTSNVRGGMQGPGAMGQGGGPGMMRGPAAQSGRQGPGGPVGGGMQRGPGGGGGAARR